MINNSNWSNAKLSKQNSMSVDFLMHAIEDYISLQCKKEEGGKGIISAALYLSLFLLTAKGDASCL